MIGTMTRSGQYGTLPVAPDGPGKAILAPYQQAMIDMLVTDFGADPFEAQVRVTRLWDRWVNVMTFDGSHTTEEAIDALSAALVFQLGQGEHVPGHLDAPTAKADDGWHAQNGHDTETLACWQILATGRRIEHRPNDMPEYRYGPGGCNGTAKGYAEFAGKLNVGCTNGGTDDGKPCCKS
jgi:hypothetical protein